MKIGARPLATAALVALIVAGWLLWPRRPELPGRPARSGNAGPAARRGPEAGPDGAIREGGGTPGVNSGTGAAGVSGPKSAPSHLADDLNAPGGSIQSDLRILDEIFQQYRSATHGANPVGENAEITRALTGKNPVDFAFIAPDNAAINAAGELTDRWGTPFFFHQLSAGQMEIRSAGPDRKLWTDDDEVITPGIHLPQH